jgi:hypothetical protein
MITQTLLKELFRYNPDTGIFIRKVSISNQVAGTIAGSKDYDYIRIVVNKKRYLAHRLAFLYMIGSMPVEVDHINRNKHDNRWCNLRPITRAANLHNTAPRNKLGVKGVEVCGNKYRAKATSGGKFYHLGVHPTIEAASKAYTSFVERRLYGFI